MTLLDIWVLDAPILRQDTTVLTEVTDDHRKLIDDMFETMYAARGIGLAAPQVGRSERLAVIDVDDEPMSREGPLTVVGDGPPDVREKKHPATPMTLDQALYEMELVGHDFFLFVDKDKERPSVVYRRRGYDYGVIALDLT